MTTIASSPRLEALKRHLRGVKRRLLWVLVAFGLGASTTWYFNKQVMLWLLAPAHGQLSASGQPIFTGPTEMFSLTLHLTTVGGLVAAVPVLVFHVARFVSPALNRRQRRFLALLLPASLVSCLAGVAFAYFVLLPAGLAFLLRFGVDIAQPMVRITEYMELALAMLFALGVVFELPLAMFLLARLRVVSYQRFGQLRRYVPAAAIIFSIIITPTTDYVNMGLVAGPIVVLFEAGMVLAWLARPRKQLRLGRRVREVMEAAQEAT